MIQMFNISLGDFRQINLHHVCSIESRQGEEEMWVIMSNGDRHKLSEAMGKMVEAALERLSGQTG